MKRQLLTIAAVITSFIASEAGAAVKKLVVTSTSFKSGKTIPDKYGCNGADVNPQLAWSKVPAGTKSIAIVMVDPQGGPWYHWGTYNIAPTRTSIPVKFSTKAANETINDFQFQGYGGPCPPGETHMYYFHVFALDTSVAPNTSGEYYAMTFYDDLTSGTLKSHVLAKGYLKGKYFSRG